MAACIVLPTVNTALFLTTKINNEVAPTLNQHTVWPEILAVN